MLTDAQGMKKNFDCLKSKPVLAMEIIDMIKSGLKKTRHSDGTFNKTEMYAVHQYIKWLKK